MVAYICLTKWLNSMVKNKKTDQIGTEATILAAARKVFTRKGMAGARMQDIADEAGINKALLHYYFKDKEKLFDTIFMAEAALFFPRLNIIFDADLPLFEKIEKFVDEYIDVMLQHPYMPWFILNELNQDADNFLKKVWAKTAMPKPIKLLQQIDAEVKKGTIRKVDPNQLMLNLLSMTIFPFVGKPMFQLTLRLSEKQFTALINERRKSVPQFIIDSIKK